MARARAEELGARPRPTPRSQPLPKLPRLPPLPLLLPSQEPEAWGLELASVQSCSEFPAVFQELFQACFRLEPCLLRFVRWPLQFELRLQARPRARDDRLFRPLRFQGCRALLACRLLECIRWECQCPVVSRSLRRLQQLVRGWQFLGSSWAAPRQQAR